MADLLFVVLTLAFFALASAYVLLCDRIIGPDPATPGTEGEPAHEADQLVAR